MDAGHDRLYRISDLEEISGIKRRTIHYYLSEGLLSPPLRTGKTMAYYNPVHVEELKQIRSLQEKGYPLSIIKEMVRGEKKPQPPAAAAVGADSKSERRRMILDKAVEVFAKKGYSQAKITDITGAVGIGQSTFYLYFPSKKALFIECVDQVFQAMFQDVWEEIKHERNPLRRLRKRFEVVIKYHPQFIDMLYVLRMAVEDNPALELRRKEIYTSILETIKGDIMRAMEQGILYSTGAEIDPDLLSYFLMSFLETASLTISLDGRYTADELLDAIDNLVDLHVRRPRRE